MADKSTSDGNNHIHMNTGGRGPWGQGPRPTGGGSGGGRPGGNRGNGQKPPQPDLDDMLREWQSRMGGMFGGGKGGGKGGNDNGGFQSVGLIVLGLIAIFLWLASGIYVVDPDEQGVVLRFGKYHATTDPGLHYHFPAPIETVLTPRVTSINSVEIGFRSQSRFNSSDLLKESLMLTGDENIVDINFEVQWKIKDAKDYLFNTRSPESAVRNAGESAMREVIGKTPIAFVLSDKRLETEIAVKELLQDILDDYQAGVEVVRVQMLKADPPAGPVNEAFLDVQTARQDRDRMINEAEAFSNQIVPRARGEAEKMIIGAEAYKERVIAQAEGEAARFLSVYEEYRKAKDVTRKRLYIETMENIMSNMDKIVIDDKISGVVPYLPLGEMQRKQKQ